MDGHAGGGGTQVQAADFLKAVQAGDTEAVSAFLNAGNADVNAPVASHKDPKYPSFVTPLQAAVLHSRIEMVRLLIERGADVNAPDEIGQTPLLNALACRSVHLHGRDPGDAIVRLLLDAGADPNRAMDGDSLCPLDWAVMHDDAPMVRLLLHRGAVPKIQPTLNLAEGKGNPEIIALLSEAAGHDLLRAAEEGNAAEVTRLVDTGRPVNLRGDEAVTPLMHAARRGHTSVLADLLDRGANVNDTDEKGSTPLIYAAQNGHTAAVHLLLERGADMTARNQWGQTALVRAGIHTNGNEERPAVRETAALLIERGSPYGIVEAALLGHEERVRYELDRAGTPPDYFDPADPRRTTALIAAALNSHTGIIDLLLDGGADIDRQDAEGHTPLYMAAARRQTPAARLLLRRGADPNARDSSQSTPLHICVMMTVAGRVDFELLTLLLDHGADPNARDSFRMTPLHKAASWCPNPGVAALLLDHGADIEARDGMGHTPLMLAAQHQKRDNVRLLLQRGADPHSQRRRKGLSPETALSAARCVASGEGDPEVAYHIMEAMGPEYALLSAAERGDLEATRALLDAGASATGPFSYPSDREEQDYWGLDTPLVAAAGSGYTGIVRLLLERGAGADTYSLNLAFSCARRKKHEEVARLLEAAGASEEQLQQQVRGRYADTKSPG
jgi:ankyrin repeat protein